MLVPLENYDTKKNSATFKIYYLIMTYKFIHLVIFHNFSQNQTFYASLKLGMKIVRFEAYTTLTTKLRNPICWSDVKVLGIHLVASRAYGELLMSFISWSCFSWPLFELFIGVCGSEPFKSHSFYHVLSLVELSTELYSCCYK